MNYPRTDLHVTAGGVGMTPPMGLTAWAAFTKTGDHRPSIALVHVGSDFTNAGSRGDLVMTEDQVN